MTNTQEQNEILIQALQEEITSLTTINRTLRIELARVRRELIRKTQGSLALEDGKDNIG